MIMINKKMENEKIIKGKIIIVEYHRQLSVYKVTCATVISDYNLTHLWPTLRSNLSNKESDTIPVSLSLNGKKIFNDNLECGYFFWLIGFFFSLWVMFIPLSVYTYSYANA